MTLSGFQIVRLAMQELGVLDPIETMTAEDGQDCLLKLNLLAESLQLERDWLFAISTVTKDLTALTQTYTIGTGGDINVPRPDFAPDKAGIIIDTAASTLTELPIDVLTDEKWERIAQKTLRSTLSRAVYYDFSFDTTNGRSRISVWPVPTVSTTRLVLYLPAQAVSQFANLSTQYRLLPGYAEALYTNLAIKIAPMYDRPLNNDHRQNALTAMGRVQRANSRTPELRCDEVTGLLTGGRLGWDYRLGDYK